VAAASVAATTNGNGVAKDSGDGASESAVTSPNTPGLAAVVTDHPSSTVAPEVQRPTAPKPPEATWNALDMGGVQIRHLPPSAGLFAYAFLTNLYLNHNQLTALPGAIARLRHLELLDVSGNQLARLPPEIGMLSDLKELYMFDNALTSLPFELGTLHQLQTLGVEGNPLDHQQLQIVQKEGTPALIAHLRDSAPVPDPPPPRTWVNVVSASEREAMAADPGVETFRVVCYNILCQRAATEKMYGYTAAWALKWEYRKGHILAELLAHQAEFICLQEVDVVQYEEFFSPSLRDAGYDGIYYPKSRYKTMSESSRRMVDGCAIFFLKAKCVPARARRRRPRSCAAAGTRSSRTTCSSSAGWRWPARTSRRRRRSSTAS
jgi:CCR4-NOT transcription complex subunit 6